MFFLGPSTWCSVVDSQTRLESLAALMAVHFVGVDVGTASVRAGLLQVNSVVKIVATAVEKITIWNDTVDHYEQSSEEIWQAVCKCVKSVLADGGVSCNDVKGIGFDATCSLVALDKQDTPLSVSLTGDNRRNVIMWMDHRAEEEMQLINSTSHPLLKFVGGKVSLEMEMPKVMWLKKNMAKLWEDYSSLMDLPDFLTHKATGTYSRSLCSLVCKWMYDASSGDEIDKHGWNFELLRMLDLQDLIDDEFQTLGTNVLMPGQAIEGGLCEQAAKDLGLLQGTPVGTSLIDAHAGGVGMLICRPESLSLDLSLEHKLGLICGTSTCHMIVNERPVFVPGVWGPYYSAMIPGMWLSEGGQSVTGKLIDHMILNHPAYPTLTQLLQQTNTSDMYATLANHAKKLALNKGAQLFTLTENLHILPDFHGNRSPLANPNMKGMVCGLNLATGLDDLTILYIATLQSLCLGTRHITDVMAQSGHEISAVYMCGGLTKNLLFVQMMADCLNKIVVVPEEKESVLLGAALCGMSAERQVSLLDVVKSVSCDGTVFYPDVQAVDYYNKKYHVYLNMIEHQKLYKQIMDCEILNTA